MKNILLAWLVMLGFCIQLQAENRPKVIAHRGYWNKENSAQNSIVALREAGGIKCYGSEFDVQLTSDGVPVVVHDAVVEGIVIEKSIYEDVKNIRLANGEGVPTLEEYLKAGKKIGKTRLILEIKPHSTPEKETRVVELVLQMVKKAGLEKKTEYISFSKHVLKEIVRCSPRVRSAYLSSDLTPAQIKELGCTGVDYNYAVIQQHPSWVEECHRLGMTVNVWTVDRPEVMKEMMEKGVDYITTNEPVLLQTLIKGKNRY